MFRVYCLKEENFVADDACTTHPHNFYAQMIAETGIIGLITMLSIFLLICYKFILNFYSICFKKQFLTDEAICLLSFYFMTLFPILPSEIFLIIGYL